MRLLKIFSRFFFRRILFVLYLSVFVFLYLILNKKEFDFSGFTIQNPFYDFFALYNSFFYAILIFIVFAVITTIVEIVLTVRNSRKMEKELKTRNAIQGEINNKLFRHLYDEHELDSDIYFVQEHRQTYTQDYPRLVFINRLRRILVLTKAEIHQRCVRIFQLLNEEELLRAYLKSPYLRHKIFAITVIGDFKLRFFDNELLRLMKHKNAAIASEAMYAYVRISDKVDFRFLAERNKPISRLDFYSFVQLAQGYKNIDYSVLIKHPVPSISALGLRFAGMHKIKPVKTEIFKRINHSDRYVSEEAQNAYIAMIDENDTVVLLSIFDAFSEKNQLRILNILGDYSKNSKVLALFDNIIENYEYRLKSAALNVLIQNNIAAAMRFRNHRDALVHKAFEQLTDY